MALTPMCLRLETPDGCAVEEYRVLDGEIEARQLRQDADENDRKWHALTPEQLTDHVNRNTVVAKWLERRLGWRPLLRACVANQNPYYVDSSESTTPHRAA